MRWTPRLRTVLITVNILILVVPLGGTVLFRLYESVLIRRTESELIAQGAVVASAFREEIRRELGSLTYAPAPERFGIRISDEVLEQQDTDDSFEPILASLDLATHIVQPSPPEALPPAEPADSVAAAAGERLNVILRDTQKVTLAGIRVVDHNGSVVATTRSELGMNLVHREEVRRSLEGVHVSLMRKRHSDEPPPSADSLSRETRLRVFVAMPVVEGDRVRGAVVLSRTPMSMRQSLYRIRWYIPAAAALVLGLVTFVALLTSRTIGRPMDELIRQTERVARGEQGAATPLERPGTHEVRLVSEAVARMAEALEARAQYISTFASGVSHEFKTPLTSIRGTVELLRDHLDTMTAEERARFLGNLESDADRLDRLVTRLTELARADVIRPGSGSAAIEAAARALAERFASEGATVPCDVEQGLPPVRMEREVLESILANLLDNARQHGGPNVQLQARRLFDPPRVELLVLDDGEGISEANAKKIFDRFFTTARDRGGSGLGLAIVRTLVEVHGGTIDLRSRPGGTAFSVVLPAASDADV